ncbi:hypothetical protein MTO96_011456 [Rhipicephalus appendiculatus]
MEDDGSWSFAVDAQHWTNASLECALFGLASARVTLPASSLQKGKRENISFTGHGSWLEKKMFKTPLLLLQMLPWFFVGLPMEDDGRWSFAVDAQHWSNASLECAPLVLLPPV